MRHVWTPTIGPTFPPAGAADQSQDGFLLQQSKLRPRVNVPASHCAIIFQKFIVEITNNQIYLQAHE